MKENFFKELYDIGNENKSVSFIIRNIDKLCRAGDFKTVDKILLGVEPGLLSDSDLIAFLSISLAARHKLLNYKELYDRLEVYFVTTRGQEQADRLLKGFIR